MTRTLPGDIRLLGDTLGAVLCAQAGSHVFDAVETMRKSAKRARDVAAEEEQNKARSELDACAQSLSPETAVEVVRAFMHYFLLVNIAEDVHRTRELRRREIEGGAATVVESLASTMQELAKRGVSREQALQALSEVHISFVFTAHPTEALRRTTERLLARVRHSLEDRDRRVLTPTEEHIQNRHLRSAIEALWQHAPQRTTPPDPIEEAKAGLWYLRNVIADVMPRLMRRLQKSVEAHWGPCDPLALPINVSFGSWMGADRDGNPYVTDGITERTLELHRWIILERYTHDLEALADPLAAFSQRLPSDSGLNEALARAASAVPEAAKNAEQRNPNEPLRKLLTFMQERISRARTFSAGAYVSQEQFLDDLIAIRNVLIASGAESLPNDLLLDLIQRVRCFGFVLATLDAREDSRVHRRVVQELLDDPQYLERNDQERIAAIKKLVLPSRSKVVSPEARRLLDSFAMIRRAHARFGPNSIRAYILSMTESAADIMEALRLAELFGAEEDLDFVPLFETSHALLSAGHIVESLLSDPTYRAHVERRGSVQEVLVGYSDSMKEGGVLASRVRIVDAQRAVARVCEKFGVKLRIFHGRGGSLSRGGGPTFRAIRALPQDAFSGDIKITEQGETRSFHFANPDLAVRYMEQTLSAAILARLDTHERKENESAQTDLLTRIANIGEGAYKSLVQDPQTLQYFYETTPFNQIAELNIASRPTRRGKGYVGLDGMRAIPWVFAWSQSRLVLTGWYGVGTALAAAEKEVGLEALARLYRDSAFFRDLIENTEMTLAKADLGIAERYSHLCNDSTIQKEIFTKAKAEYELTCSMIIRIADQQTLLDDDIVLQRSIRLRNPYVDPMSYLQVHALRQLRTTNDEATRAAWDTVARVAVQGIAAGLRNTG